MSKRKLLEENTVSKFMKLANIDSSRSKRFLKEMYGYDEGKTPEEEEEGMYGMSDMDERKLPHEQEEMGYAGGSMESMDIDELNLDQYMNEAEDEGKEDKEDEMGELSMTSEEAKDIVSALEKLLDKLKTAVDSGPEEEAPEEPEMEEPEMEEPEGGEEMPPEEEEAPEGEEESPAALQEALINKVAKRVAARLLRESKAKKPVKPVKK